MRTSWLIGIAGLFSATTAFIATAPRATTTVRVSQFPPQISATANPTTFSGKCPARFTFVGTYTIGEGVQRWAQGFWEFSDGTKTQKQQLVFVSYARMSSGTIESTWSHGQAGEHGTGWAKLHLTLPGGAIAVTPPATVTYTCKKD